MAQMPHNHQANRTRPGFPNVAREKPLEVKTPIPIILATTKPISECKLKEAEGVGRQPAGAELTGVTGGMLDNGSGKLEDLIGRSLGGVYNAQRNGKWLPLTPTPACLRKFGD